MHELTKTNGKVEFAYAKSDQKPWHGLGTEVPGLMTTNEALKFGGVDWTVSKKPVYDHTDLKPIDGYNSLTRDDTNEILSVVGNRYALVQNHEAFEFFDHVLHENQARIDTVGSIRNGKNVFMMAKLPDQAEIVRGDVVNRYLLVTNPFDGKSAINVCTTQVRVVCSNTLTYAMNRCSNHFKIRHSNNWKFQMKEAQEAIRASNEYWEELTKVCKEFAATDVSRVEVGDFLEKLFPSTSENIAHIPKPRIEVLKRFESGIGSDIPGVKGTKWGLINAVTEYLDHERGRGNSWESSLFGNGATIRNKAMSLLMAKA